MFKNKAIWLIIVIIILVIVGWLFARQPLFKPNWPTNNANNTSIVNQPDTVVVKPQVVIKDKIFDVVVADEPAIQRQGLSGQASLADNQGMLFIYSGAQILTFWMKDMKFNVDLLWLDGDQVVAFEKNMLAPEIGIADDQLLRYTSPQAVDKVLEIPSGSIDALGIKAGDKVIFKNI